MDIDYNEKDWATPCPKYDCRKTACKCGLKYVNIPASLGDDSEGSKAAPKNGAYCNALVVYEDNGHVYLYSKEGIPTLIDVDASDISVLEQEVIKAQKDVHELREDIDRFAYFFDTVADMRSFSNLKSGDYVKTLGFYSANDGGGAYYKISSTGTANGMDVISLNGGLLKAVLIVANEVNVKQLGARGNNTDDDTSILNYALSKWVWKNVHIPTGNYKISDTIYMTESKTVYGDGVFNTNLYYYGTGKAVQISNNYYGVLTIKELSILKNGGYDENESTSIGIGLSRGDNNRTVSNLYMDKVTVRYFHRNFDSSIDGARMGNSHFTNCNFEGGYDNFFIYSGFNNSFDACRFGEARHCGYFQQSGEGKFVACSFEGNKNGVILANSNGAYSFIDCFFETIDTSSETNSFLLLVQRGQLALMENISVINCHFYGGYDQVFLTGVRRVTFMNNTMFNPGHVCVAYGWTNPDFESITFINNNFAVEPHSGPDFVHFYG